MAIDQVLNGGCFCGDLRYEIRGPSVWSSICYCASCTRITGALAVAWTGIEKSRFRIVKGELRHIQSTPGIWRGFCPRCGTALTYRKDPEVVKGARDDVYITTRSLDDPGAYPPEDHVFYGERVSWFEVNDERPHNQGTSAKYGHLQYLKLTGRE
jgi:hypothetical protein